MCEEFLAAQLDLPMQSAHGGEFSSQVSGSAGRWLLQRSGGSIRSLQLQRIVGAQLCLRRLQNKSWAIFVAEHVLCKSSSAEHVLYHFCVDIVIIKQE